MITQILAQEEKRPVRRLSSFDYLVEIVHTSSNDYSPGISTGVYQRYYIVPAGFSSYTIEQTHDLYQADMGIVREDSTERLTLKW